MPLPTIKNSLENIRCKFICCVQIHLEEDETDYQPADTNVSLCSCWKKPIDQVVPDPVNYSCGEPVCSLKS